MYFRSTTFWERLPDIPRWAAYLLILTGVIGWEAVKAWLERRKQSWPVVEGTIAGVYTLTEFEKHVHQSTSLPYSYYVNGEEYFGADKTFIRVFDAFPKGSRILVHYNPSNPADSRLDRKQVRDREDVWIHDEN
jgi:hypothetical protein